MIAEESPVRAIDAIVEGIGIGGGTNADNLYFVGGRSLMYEGAIIKETLTDELLLDFLVIDKVDIWKTNDTIKYWTMIFFHSETEDLPQRLANIIIDDWFADMKSNNIKYIVFKNKVLKYEIGNATEKDKVLDYMRSRGIPEIQFNWSE